MTTTDPAPARPVADVTGLTVGVLGGTGPQGRGLAVRLAAAGQRMVLGGRDATKAAAVAAEVAARAATVAAPTVQVSVTGGLNADVCAAADLVIVAVPYAGHADTLRELAGPLAGTVVVDCVVPMGWDEFGAYLLPVPEGSAALQAAALLPDSTVVGAFHHLSARLLEDLTHPTLEGDVLVVGDDRAAMDLVQALADRLPGMRGVYAGRLRNAAQVEALTINLVSVNRRYKVHAGVQLTGL